MAVPGVSNELIYEILERRQEPPAKLQNVVRGIREEVSAVRGHMLAMQRDIHNTYDRLDEHSQRLDRIERRLELSDTPV
jgi:hypothetical protein